MTPLNIPATIQAALAHHQSGRLPQAEALYRQVLAVEPNNVHVLHFLGVLAQQVGQHAQAVQLIGRALQLHPGYADAHNNLGNVLREQGRIEEAIAHYQQALRLKPDYSDAHNNLGVIRQQQGQWDAAVAHYQQALRLRPNDPKTHNNLGIVRREQKKPEEAIAHYRQALQINPDYPEAHSNLAVVLQEQKKYDEAITHYERALALNPDYPEAHNNLGTALREQKKLDEAIAHYQRALQIKPDYPDAYNNLGLALHEQDRYDEAMAHYQKALELKPDYAEAYYNLGNTYHALGQLQAAISQHERAIRLKGDFALAHWNLSLALLLSGDLVQGWKKYEWRWEACEQEKRVFPCPAWKGDALVNGTVMLYAEQGVGDTLQFVRYAPLVAERCRRVIIECQPSLRRLFRCFEGIAEVVDSSDEARHFDHHAALLSLPGIFGTTLDRIPASIPYIRVDPDLTASWRARIGDTGGKLKVGLAWAGNPHHNNDRNRSCPLSVFAPLAGVSHAIFFSLQKGDIAQQARTPPPGMSLADCTDEISDYADTAALMQNLDLVISVDTSVAHLAGALGRPVWSLLPFAPDWRWFLHRSDSPWYPTMRLFRQARPGDWTGVMESVVTAMMKLGHN